MKRIATWFAVAAFVAVFGAGAAWAGVEGTAHQTAVGQQGYCSACHMPHKAPSAKRLWPANMSTLEAAYGDVGSLCYYCHGNGGGAGLADAVQNNVMTSGAGSQAEFSHGLTAGDIPPGGNGLGASGLPYVANASIECTSCHNVHDDTNRPFLRANIDVICAYCHTDRLFTGGAAYTLGDPLAAWGAFYGNTAGAANPGSHPVGTDVDGDSDGTANSPISFAGRVAMAKSNVASEWSLGGHLAGPAGGALAGMTCTTCHAPHGVDLDDPTPPTAAEAPVVDLLAVDQTSDGTSAGDHGDGDNLAADALCETCHVEAVVTWDPGTGAAYAGTLNPNPGATAYTHPVDNLGSANTSVPNGADFPAGGASWPVGLTPGANMDPAVICESCHTPHPLANDAQTIRGSADYVEAASGTHILRQTEELICGECHTAAVADHHPIGAYDTGRFDAALIGDNASPLTCGDCHNGAGAHNWTGPSNVGLDPDWVPANNGRGLTCAEENTLALGANRSSTCVDCHTGNGNHYAPTSNSADDGTDLSGTQSLRLRTRGSYQDTGDGSHFLGNTDPANLNYANGTRDNGATTEDHSATGCDNWPDGGWSLYDMNAGNVNHVVCEACHELEPDKNHAGSAMLLDDYSEGLATYTNAPFCEGCHSNNPGGANPHPMTGDTISRAALAGEAPALTTAGRYSKAVGSWTGSVTAPAADQLNCDSCHQPHDTDTNGGTYIYESDAVGTVTATTDPTPDGDPGHPGRGSTAVGIQDLPFCNQCHEY